MKSKLRTLAIIGAVLAVVATFSIGRERRPANGDLQEQERATGTIDRDSDRPQSEPSRLSAILLVNLQSCPCTRGASLDAEAIMKRLKKKYGDVVAFQTVDWEAQHEEAVLLFKRFNAFFVPVLVVLNTEGRVVWRCTDFSREKSIDSKFGRLIAEAPLANGDK